MEFVITIVGLVGEHSWGPIKRHLGYLIFYKRNIDNMDIKFGELDAKRKDVQRQVQAAYRERLEEADSSVEAWLENVENADEDVKRIKDESSTSAATNNKGFLHLCLHHRLGKQAAAQIQAIDDLLVKKGNFDRVSHSRPPPSTTGSLFVNEGYVMFESRKSYINEILNAFKVMSDEESWLLFKSRAGNVVESLTMKEVAWNVAKQCAGLPLALVVLGTALKGKNLEVWKTVLNQLKKSTMALDLPGVSNKVRESIELSYNFLESEAAKWCFLHCCLYPENYDNIEEDELMHMLVGGGLLEDVESLHEAQDRVHVLMDQLKVSGLLLEGQSLKSNVRMHDVVRDVAITTIHSMMCCEDVPG